MKKITQDELVPYIVKVLYESGGYATKSQVENKIYELHESIFQHKWYHATVSHGVPRWKHDIAWAKERARLRRGTQVVQVCLCTARKSVSQRIFLCYPNCAGHCVVYDHKNDLGCASLSAFESGLFCRLFVAADKKSVAEGIKRKY